MTEEKLESTPEAIPEVKPLKKLSSKTFMLFVAAWFVGMAAIFIGSIIYNNVQAGKYQETAVPYLEKAIPVLSQWNPEQIKGLITPEALEKIPDDKYLTLIDWFSRLGKLQSIDEIKFEKKDSRTAKTGLLQTIVEYDVSITYEHGEALLNIKLLEDAGTFSIYHFSFSSERLAVEQLQKKE